MKEECQGEPVDVLIIGQTTHFFCSLFEVLGIKI